MNTYLEEFPQKVMTIGTLQLLPSHSEDDVPRAFCLCRVVIVEIHLPVIGLLILPARVSGRYYLNVCFNTHLHTQFQRDGAPTHYGREVRQWLSENYPGRWTGREHEASVSWPARSPNMNTLDFFLLWGCLKTKVHASTVVAREELWLRVEQFSSEIKKKLV
jgi:hypothetical protein